MKKFFSTAKAKVLGAIGFASVAATSASAAIDVSAVSLDVTPVETIAVVMLGALSLIWVGRKVISFLR